jgi:CHAT domain-containing protein
MLTPPPPPADLIDQRNVFESYLRLSMAAHTQGRFDDFVKFQEAAYQAVLDDARFQSQSLLFMRHALGALDARRSHGLDPSSVRNDPALYQRNLVTYLKTAEMLLAENPFFIGDARAHLYHNHVIDLTLAGLTDFREAIPLAREGIPLARERIEDLSFRLAQWRSFGRLTVAMVRGETTRAELSSALPSVVERFLQMATQNAQVYRNIFDKVRRRPEEPPPNGDVLWPAMFTMYNDQNETTGQFSEYLAYLQRTVPTIAELATEHPHHLIEFQRLLLPGEVLVATQVTSSALYVWAITPGGVQVARQWITEAEVTNTVTRLRASLRPSSGSQSSSLPGFDAASAYQLYSLIFAPIADQLRGVRTLIWYGQGPLSAVPPAILVSAPPATPTATTAAQLAALPFLVDRFAIAVLPDLSMFPQMRAKTPASLRAGKFLGIGAPLISADEIDGARRSQSDELARGFSGKSLADLPKLPEAADEMKALAALFPVGESTLLLGPAADEHGFVGDRLLAFGTIAFATHGFLADEIENYYEPSLMLALAPNANDRFDGILTASEIASLRLNADLVILSACNTAGSDGRPHGDAFTGLTQAFFSAGARNLLVSQWPVMSGAAVQLSVGTVERALNGKETLARSLQLAMQALRKGATNALEAHPAYWGPFVIAGDGR